MGHFADKLVSRHRHLASALKAEETRVREATHLAQSIALQEDPPLTGGMNLHEQTGHFLANSEMILPKLKLKALTRRGHGPDAVEDQGTQLITRLRDEGQVHPLETELHQSRDALRKKHGERKAAMAKLKHLRAEHEASDPSRNPSAHAARAAEIEQLHTQVYGGDEQGGGHCHT